MKNFFLSLLLVFGVIISGINAQIPSIQISNVTECPGNELLVPVDITDFESIGAITLYIEYDSAVVQFIGAENVHPQFIGMIFNSILNPQPKIGITWSNVVGQSVEEGKLFDLRFLFSGGECDLSFMQNCEIANTNLQVVNVDYIDGQVAQLFSILSQPENTTVNEPEAVQFSIIADGSINYLWQVSTDGGEVFTDLSNSIDIQGVFTPDLQLLVTNTNIDGYFYRCRLSDNGCVIYSEAALLTVLPEIYNATYTLQEGWGSLSSYIDPEDPLLEILFEQILESVEILISGDQIFYPQGGINTIGSFDPYSGYAIKMSANENLQITGYKVDSVSVLVPQGWNYLPVLSPCDVTIGNISFNFLKNVKIIKEIAGVDLYWPEKDINSLESLKNGNAYLIYMDSETTLIFPECD